MSASPEPEQPRRNLLLGGVMLALGCLVAIAGRNVLRLWPSISTAYAACGVLWIAAGPVMALAGLWVLGSLGRHRLPLRVGGVALLLSGGIWVAGAITFVIPCTPST